MHIGHLVETFHLPGRLCGLLGDDVAVTADYQHYLTTTSLRTRAKDVSPNMNLMQAAR